MRAEIVSNWAKWFFLTRIAPVREAKENRFTSQMKPPPFTTETQNLGKQLRY